VDSTTVTNPILWEKGIRTMLGVPLLSGEDVFGVLHVGRCDHRLFTDNDAELLQVAAERVAGATQARQLAIESAAARLLERSLQPSRLPRLPGVQLAARYVTAESRLIGGDWYDAFTVPSGQLWLVVGDVAGHGLKAAVVMGRVKSALRAYALECDSPHEALERTDHKMQHFEVGTVSQSSAWSPRHRTTASTSARRAIHRRSWPSRARRRSSWTSRPFRRSAPFLTSPAAPGPSRCLKARRLFSTPMDWSRFPTN
jgi:hypothetical protein